MSKEISITLASILTQRQHELEQHLEKMRREAKQTEETLTRTRAAIACSERELTDIKEFLDGKIVVDKRPVTERFDPYAGYM